MNIADIKPPLDYHYKRIVWGVQGADKKLKRFITLQPGQIERRVKLR